MVLYGWHTVMAALANPQRHFRRLLATENAARRLAEEKLSPVTSSKWCGRRRSTRSSGPDAVHQGLYAETDPLPSPALEDVASGILLVLDQITDPHNVGAILRSAAAFGVTAAVTTARHSPEATGVLAKAASGALEYVPIVTIGNLAQALRTLKDLGTLLVGLDSSGEADLADVVFSAPVALVLGAEGKGLRQLTRTNCDVVARLDLPGAIESLNVSNAAALALYIATTVSRRDEALCGSFLRRDRRYRYAWDNESPQAPPHSLGVRWMIFALGAHAEGSCFVDWPGRAARRGSSLDREDRRGISYLPVRRSRSPIAIHRRGRSRTDSSSGRKPTRPDITARETGCLCRQGPAGHADGSRRKHGCAISEGSGRSRTWDTDASCGRR